MRQADADRRERTNQWLATLGLWIGFLEVWAAAVTTHAGAGISDPALWGTFLVILTPALVGMVPLWLLVRGLWPLVRWLRRSWGHALERRT